MVAVVYRLHSTLGRRWPSTVLLIVAIAMVTGVVLAIAAGARRTDTAADRFSAAWGGDVDAMVIQQDGGQPITDQLRALPGAESADPLTFVFAALVPEGSDASVDVLPFVGTVASVRGRLLAGRAPDRRNGGTDPGSGSTVVFSDALLGIEGEGGTVGVSQSIIASGAPRRLRSHRLATTARRSLQHRSHRGRLHARHRRGSGAVRHLPDRARRQVRAGRGCPLDRAAQPNVVAVRFGSGPDADDGIRVVAAAAGGDPDGIRFRPAVIVNVDRLRNIPFVLALLIGAPCVMTVVNIVFSSVRHRQRELAILRSLGAGGSWIVRAVHWQASLRTSLRTSPL